MSIVKLPELSNILGIGQRQINKLAKAGIIPKARRGEYDLAGTVRAYIDYLKDGDEDKQTTLHDQQIKYLKAQTKKIELEIEQKEGRLIPDTEFVKVMERHIIAARTNFLMVENEIPRIRASESLTEAKEIFRGRAHAILAELAKAEIVVAGNGQDDPTDDEALGAAPDANDKPVGRGVHVAKSGRLKRARKVPS